MYQARYFKTDGTKGSDVSLPKTLFDGTVNEAVLHQSVKAYLANQRQGTASAKSRSEVAGGSRKPWRQKGTGRARQGTIRAAQWSGGGVAFPPQPHSWRQKLPKRSRAIARRSALNSRAEAGRVIVVEGFGLEAPKTGAFRKLLESLDTQGKVLVLTHGVNKSVYLSGRNLPGVAVMPFGEESPYDVLWSGTVVIEKAAIENVPESGESGERPRRRPVDHEALAQEAAEQAARKEARRAPATGSVDKKAAKPAPSKATKPAESKVVKSPAKAPEAKTPEDGEAKTAPLPKVSDLPGVLAELSDEAAIRDMMDRDTRKTAVAHYEARLAELTGGGEEEE